MGIQEQIMKKSNDLSTIQNAVLNSSSLDASKDFFFSLGSEN